MLRILCRCCCAHMLRHCLEVGLPYLLLCSSETGSTCSNGPPSSSLPWTALTPEQRPAGGPEEQDEGGDQGVQVPGGPAAAGLHGAGGGEHHPAETGLHAQAEPGQEPTHINNPKHTHVNTPAHTFEKVPAIHQPSTLKVSQSDLPPFIHTPTAESTTQGDSQLVGSSQGEASSSGTL